jgi:hypothetical protein
MDQIPNTTARIIETQSQLPDHLLKLVLNKHNILYLLWLGVTMNSIVKYGLILALSSAAVAGEVFVSVYSEPDYDRWNYPYNGTPGERSVASTFSSYGSPYDFDDRDGQTLLGYVTVDIPTGLPASAYRVVSLSVDIAVASDDINYDPTVDDRATHEVDGPADPDPGRAACLSGVGFRGGFDAETYGETGPHPFGAVRGLRHAYAMAYDADGQAIDISNNLTEGFDPNFFGVGMTDEVLPGELIPELGRLRFDVDVQDADIACYLSESLAFGTVDFMLTSLNLAAQPGSGGEVNYPNWMMKDHALVQIGAVEAATMWIEVEVRAIWCAW